MSSVFDVTVAAEKLWPLAGAEEWDRPGLITGSTLAHCNGVLLSVDVTLDVIDEAIESGCNMIVSHHPFLLGFEHDLALDSAKGAVLAKAISHDIALYSAHTNADVVADGVSGVLAKAFGLAQSKPLVAGEIEGQGHGRIAELSQPMTLLEFSRLVARALPPTAAGVRVAGDAHAQIRRVALCGGSGGSFIEAAFAQGADVFVTSDLRHHTTSDAVEAAKATGRDFALIDISHWAAESIWLGTAQKQLQAELGDVKFVVSDLRTDPWYFAVTQ
jgi:dinuclear metal center YbgI/SA1388 family protein